MGLREQKGREFDFLEASKPRVRTQSAQFGPFANLDVKSKTTADFTNRPHPPNQLRDPQKGSGVDFPSSLEIVVLWVSRSDTFPGPMKCLRIFSS